MPSSQSNQASAAQRQLRSSVKPNSASGLTTAPKGGGSKVAAPRGPAAAAAALKSVKPANKKPPAPSSALPLGGGGAQRVTSAKKAAAFSPIQPKSLQFESAVGKGASKKGKAVPVVAHPPPRDEAAPESDSSDEEQAAVALTSMSADDMYELILAEIPSFSRFKNRWESIGSLSGQNLATHYDPNTFVSDIIRDLSTANEAVDRVTAVQVLNYLAWQIQHDSAIPFRVRRPWVLKRCEFDGSDIPEPYTETTVNRYAKEAADARAAKRKKTGGSAGSAIAVKDNSSDSSEAESSDSDGENADTKFSAVQALHTLTSETVWGAKAGFAVVPHDEILKIHAEKADAVKASGQVNSKQVAVVWPHLDRWNKQSWLQFEKKWWVSVNQAVENGCYCKITSLIDLDLHVDIRQDLDITDWFKTEDITFLRKAHGFFGPKNNEQAKEQLDSQRLYAGKQRDPTSFLRSLSTYNTAFLRSLDLEIAPSIPRWPKKGEAKYGPLTLKSIRASFKKGFSHDKEYSEACKHCFNICEQNPKWNHSKLYSELRAHFLADEASLSRATMKGATHGGSEAGGKWQKRGREDDADHGGRGRDNKRARGGSPGGQASRNSRNSRDSADGKDKDFKFKVVKGSDRGKVCGDYTNHYGKGCSAKTCLYFGTTHAKDKNYVWKDSDKEPKVTVSSKEFQELKAKKPDVVKTNNDNRDAYRASANKGSFYSSSASACDLVEVHEFAAAVQCKTPQVNWQFVTHDGKSYSQLPPKLCELAEAVSIDLVRVARESNATAELKELGWSERFFGVAAFLPASGVPSAETSFCVCNLSLMREVQTGKYKREPRKAKGIVIPDSTVNVINASTVSLASEFGKLKQVLGQPPPAVVVSDGRPYVQLLIEFQAADGHYMTVSDWFVIDPDNKLANDNVHLCAEFAVNHKVKFENVVSPKGLASTSHVKAEHKKMLGRVLFDPGAQMNCISENLVVPHLCIATKQVNASILQMGVVVARCSKAVQMKFELIDASLNAETFEEWFLVFNNPYGIVLGEQFCRPFTTWRDILAPWNDDDVQRHFRQQTDVNSEWMEYEEANEQPESATEPAVAIAHVGRVRKRSNRPSSTKFVSKHPVSGYTLNHRDAGQRPIIGIVDRENFKRDENDRLASGVWSESSRRAFEAQKCIAKEKRLYGLMQSLPKEERVACDVAELQDLFAEDQRALCLRIRHEIVGLPVGLMMGCGQSALVKRSHLFEPAVRLADSVEHQQFASANTPLSNAMKYFVRNLIDSHQVPWTLQCQRIQPWRADVEQKRFDELEAEQKPPVARTVNSDAIPQPQPFVNGTIVRFQNCKRLPEFNGKLGRLYDETNVPGTWRIRVLGKDGGQFVSANTANFVIHESQRQFVSAADANFHDVGLDDGGMPVESADDMPKPVHRQFGKEYSAELTRKIKELVAKYPQLFDGDISEQCLFEEMDILLKPNSILPSRSRYYRNTPRMKEEVRRQVQEQLDMGIISKAQTAVVSNVLLVKRPHMPGRYRFVVDFREVNAVTVPEQLMMPDVKSQHDRLANKHIFGAVDISSYYRLIGLKKDCRYLTGFATDEGTFVYNRVPMGVRNACSHAQRVLQDALSEDEILGVRGANIRNYFDDIAWGSNTEDEFLKVLEALLEFGVKHKLKFNAEKSCFGVDSITHVGFIVNKDGVRIDPERTRDIAELEAPKSTKKIQSILGVLNFVRNFVPEFSIKAKFLTDRLEKAAVKKDASKFVWTPDDARQFQELKELVLTAPLLSVLDYSRPIFIRCDSSRFGAGAVLFQYDAEGREMPVCYASRKYTATETRYSTFQQEMGAVVWALERFQEYCMGYPVIVETDHRNISYVKRSAMPQLARWRMRLEAFDFEVHYRCGALQQVADGLSRAGCDEDGLDAVAVHYSDVLPESTLAHAAPPDALAMIHVDALAINYDDTNSDLAQRWQHDSANINVNVDVLPVAEDSDSDSESSVEIDEQGVEAEHNANDNFPDLPWHDAGAVDELLRSVHNDMAGHGGVLVTLQRVLKMGKPQASRKQMLADIDAFLKGCVGCQKMRKRSSGSAVTRRVISGNPFEELSVDILKLPFPDAHGNAYVVTIVDNFSHWVSTYACPNKSAVSAVRALIHHIGIFGVPLRIRSDGGGEFCNDIIVQLTQMLGTERRVVLPYAHTANGIAERANRSILERLRFILFDRRIKKQPKLQWSDLLPLAQRIINASVHSAIGTSPAKLIFGDHLDLDRCILTKPVKPVQGKLVTEYVEQLSAMQGAMLEAANLHQIAMQAKVVAKADKINKGKPARQLVVGSLVLIKPLKDFPMNKLAPRELGPREIVEFADGGIVFVLDPHSLKISKVFEHQCELFDSSMVDSVEGQKIVAETDGFEFAVESILAHGIDVDDEENEIMPLGADYVRTLRAQAFAFLIKWAGYERPTWVNYKAARLLPHFSNYVDKFPNLRMGNHA